MIFDKDFLAEVSLYEFTKQSWATVRGSSVEFIDGPHIKLICEHYQAIAEKKIRNLLINIPPRHLKSTIGSVMLPAWLWIHDPQRKFMYASYGHALSLGHSKECRRLIQSDWYQKRWGDKYFLKKDQNAKARFDTNKGGYRIATSVGGMSTGEGANILFVDDPHNLKDRSQKKLENTLEWFTQVWPTRLNNQKTDCNIVIMQRCNISDISQYIIDNVDYNRWELLILPFEFDVSRKAITSIGQDFRTKEGEFLWKGIDANALKTIKHTLGVSEYATQFQQLPSPKGGNIIQKSWFKLWKYDLLPEIEYTIQSWDTALTANDSSSYSACTTWGIFQDFNKVQNIILLSMWRGKVEYPELRKMAKRLYLDYRDINAVHNPSCIGKTLDMCLVEAKASGHPLIQDLYQAGIACMPFNPTKYGEKLERVRIVSHLIEQGLVWLPTQKPNYDKPLFFAETFLESAAAFPNDTSNDLIDTMTQAFMKLKEMNFFTSFNKYKKNNLYIGETNNIM